MFGELQADPAHPHPLKEMIAGVLKVKPPEETGKQNLRTKNLNLEPLLLRAILAKP
jgi:hypothetical protein